MKARIAFVVPSLGQSPDQEAALASFRGELAAMEGELVWVMQGSAAAPPLAPPHERLLRLSGAPGFAVAANAGIASTAGDLVALVNDDVVLRPGWLAALARELDEDPGLGAVQGAQLELARPDRVDGCGIAWNRGWEAVQVAHGESASALPRDPFELFGVSGTAALFRRRALVECALAGGEVFEPRLGSWYEDVELAVRLRAAGWRARCVPSALALHRGSATGSRRPFARGKLLARNRWLVVARLLGRRFPAALPRLAARDLAGIAQALARGELIAAAAIAAGVAAALRRLPHFARRGAPLVDGRQLARFRVGSPA